MRLRAADSTRPADRGATALEYTGLIVVGALILGAIVAVGLPAKVRTHTGAAICRIVGGTDCGEPLAQGGRPADGTPTTEPVGTRPGTRPLTDGGKQPARPGEPAKGGGCHGFWGCTWSGTKKFLGGGGSAVADMGSGIKTLFTTNPVDTGWNTTKYVWSKSGGAAVNLFTKCPTGHWSECGKAAACTAENLMGPGCLMADSIYDDGVKQDAKNGNWQHGLGRLTVNIGSFFIPTKIPGLAKLGKLGKGAKEGEEAGKGLKAGKKPPKPKRWRNPQAWRKGAVYFDDDARYQKWLDDTMGPQTERLPADERQALYDYRLDPDYRDINEALRGERAATPKAADDIKKIDAAMERSRLPRDVITSRMVGDDAFDRPLSQLKGSVQTNKAYTSVNAAKNSPFRPKVWQNMAKRGVRPVELHLRVPKGTKALYPGNLDGAKYVAETTRKDPEIVLHRGIKYRIDNVVKVDGTWEVYGTVIP